MAKVKRGESKETLPDGTTVDAPVEQKQVQLQAVVVITVDLDGKPGLSAKGADPWDAYKMLKWAEDQLLNARPEKKENADAGDEGGADKAAEGGDSPAEAGA